MRLLFFMITASFLQVSAFTNAQTITLKGNNIALKTIFNEIRKQTGFNVLYGEKLLSNKKTVDLDFNKASLKDVLEQVLIGQKLDFTIEEHTIIIKAAGETITDRLLNVLRLLKLIQISGRLSDPDGHAIAGATIKVAGKDKTTISDVDGHFYLSGVEENAQLLINCIGFEPKQVAARADIGTIILTRSTTKLNEVQIQAYGQVYERLSTANIAAVKAADIEKQPVNNPILALQGRVPGITIDQTSGNAGANVTVRIQGQNSIAQGNNPFYVIDGVPYLSENQTSLAFPLQGGSPLSFLNPESIESIEVLKDADATSIYGSRAANGAIIITTKKGAAGKTKIDFNAQHGVSQNKQESEVLNTDQYIAVTKEGFVNDGVTSNSPEYTSAYAVNGTYDAGRNIDWQKVLAGKAAGYSDYQFSISGGGNNTTFLAGGNYHNENSVYPGDLNDYKKSAQFSLSNHTSDNKFNFLLSANYLVDDNSLPRYNLYSQALWLAPNAPDLYNTDGSLNWGQLPDGTVTFRNPLRNILQKYQIKSNNLVANSVIGYQIMPGLDIKGSFGYNRLESDESFQNPLASFSPDMRNNAVVSAQQSDRTTENWIIEPQITYKRKISKGVMDALLGATFQNSNANLLSLQGSGFANDSQLSNFKAAPTISIVNTEISKYIYNAIFGRLSYVYNEKFIGNFTLRRDGSSRFGQENKFNTFYSVAGGYIFSEEKFIANALPALSYGKLKVSYGTSGSDQIPNYNYLSLYQSFSGALVPYEGISTSYPASISNPYLKWEKTNKFNIGLDLGFMRNQVLLSADYYQNNSSNQLVRTPLSYLTGFNSILENLPATVRNSGWEFTLNVTAVTGANFKWNSSINLTIPKNKLVSFPDLSDNPTYINSLVIGQPLNLNKLYNYQGVNSETGLYQFLSSTGELTSNPSYLTDNYIYSSPFPKYYGGFHNSFTYKQFQLDFLLQYVHQKVADYLFGDGPGSDLNSPAFVAGNRWTSAGQTASVQKVSNESDDVLTALGDVVYSTANYQSGSYLRLKNASISYILPKSVTNFLKIRDLRVYVLGQNLFTVTKLNRDPETSIYNLPALRVLTAGIKAGIN